MSEREIDSLLKSWAAGDLDGLNGLMTILIDELLELAAMMITRASASGVTSTLEPGELVGEFYAVVAKRRSASYVNKRQFLWLFARTTRRILINHDRFRRTSRRGGRWVSITLDKIKDLHFYEDPMHADLLLALDDLERIDRRASRALDLWNFVGLSTGEIAEVLDVSRSTVRKDLRSAREILQGQLVGSGGRQESREEGEVEEIFQDTREETCTAALLDVQSEIKRYFARNPKKLYKLEPRKFEELVADILKDFGFDVELTPATRDGGFDIYAYIKNQVADFLMLVECKRWAADKPVGLEVVQRVYGVQQARGANKSMIVTTSFFTKPASLERERYRTLMDLRDYDSLTEWLARYK